MSIINIVLFIVICILGLAGFASAEAPPIPPLRRVAADHSEEEDDDDDDDDDGNDLHAEMHALIEEHMLRLAAEEQEEVRREVVRQDPPTAVELETIRLIATRHREINERRLLAIRHRMTMQHLGQPPNREYLDELFHEINELQRLNNLQRPNPPPAPGNLVQVEREDPPSNVELENIELMATRRREINQRSSLALRHRMEMQRLGQPPNREYMDELFREVRELQRLNRLQRPNPPPAPGSLVQMERVDRPPAPGDTAAMQPNTALPVNIWGVRAAQLEQLPRVRPQRAPRGPPADVQGVVQRGGRGRARGRARRVAWGGTPP
ncbi:uncharacterized protein H6S33_010808 [Morchella sextelata]|uniref:uncharacterized protein n=1 Tax=Morchella sextelata TaxID=1174677 RepID=UPI001D056053|nr:uncharacterized protein H6S33_010808 [Morchella sextelata]KAH0611543.1 hypothetical protein H6S33_010808 [Morchella sextelata]